MKKCWARDYPSCGGGISGEHLVSHGLFRNGKTVNVQGLPWCVDAPKTVGIKALTANILCRDHNSVLSPLDEVAVGAFNIFRAKFDANRLKTSPIALLMEKPGQINGLLLERWFLKTMLNLAAGGRKLIGPSGTEPGVPPVDLVEVVFGRRAFDQGAGLSALVAIGMPITFGEEIGHLAIYENDVRLMGAVFSFFGVAFLLWLGGSDRRLPIDALQQLMPAKWGRVQSLLTPPKAIQVNVTSAITITAIELLWDRPLELRMPLKP